MVSENAERLVDVPSNTLRSISERLEERPSLATLEIAKKLFRPVFYDVVEEDEILKQEYWNRRNEV